MPNYIINECITNDEYILSASTLTLGETISFSIGGDDSTTHCGTVGGVTDSPQTANISLTSYETDCCTCLTSSGILLNFTFKRCDNEEYFTIEGDVFCESIGVPIFHSTYGLQYGSEPPFCATFERLDNFGTTNYNYVSGPHSVECECEEPPISANTESTICQEVCDNSVITITPLHPTYINSAGREVVQMNAVLIGGNGLNS